VGTSPTVQPFDVVNGTVTWTGAGNFGTISATTDRSIISWKPTAFNIAQGELFSFQVPAGGGILNKVGYGTTGTITTTPDTAIINGGLQSNGRVFILANGNIFIGGNASISTQGGLFLSTLLETDNFNFSALGNLAVTGAPTGTIQIGGSNTFQGTTNAAKANIVGNLTTWGGTTTVDNILVTGDMIVNSRTAGVGLTLTGLDGTTQVTGNLSATTNAGTIGQNAAQPLLVTNQTTLNTTGNFAVNLNTNTTNDFGTVSANVGSLLLSDANSIALGNSTIATALSVSALNNISTNGTVTVATGGTVNLASSVAGNVTFANNSTVGGTLSGSAANGNFTSNTVGAVTTGAISAPLGAVSVGTNGTLTVGGAISGGNATLTGASLTSTGGSVTTTAGSAIITATAWSVILPTVTAPAIGVSAAGGSISQFGSSILTTTLSGASSQFNAGSTGSIALTNTNAMNNPVLTMNGTNIAVTNSNALTLGQITASGSVTINTTPSGRGAGNVTVGSGFGTAGLGLNVAGGLNITTNASNVT